MESSVRQRERLRRWPATSWAIRGCLMPWQAVSRHLIAGEPPLILLSALSFSPLLVTVWSRLYEESRARTAEGGVRGVYWTLWALSTSICRNLYRSVRPPASTSEHRLLNHLSTSRICRWQIPIKWSSSRLGCLIVQISLTVQAVIKDT